uniref:Putative replicase n=1 Tax=Mafsystermes virus TaxID=2796611 RepID=A0A7T7GV33_9VIRU|nr:putative replicase [Mafsystermes virus]
MGERNRVAWNPFGLPVPSPSYVWPRYGSSAVRESFCYHSEQRARAKALTCPPNAAETAAITSSYFGAFKIRYPVPDIHLEGPWFRSILRRLNPKSSPGLGLFRGYPTIGDALGWDGANHTNAINVAVLTEAVRVKLANLLLGKPPDDLMLFIKEEPHKKTKAEKGAWRLIAVPSLEDQVVDRVLMTTWQDTEQRSLSRIPPKSGWSPLPTGHYFFERTFSGPVLATDCSAFDWTVPEWACELLLELSIDMLERDSPGYVRLLRARWAQVLRDAVVRLPDGTRWRQTGWGVMKSGWFRTIAFNSCVQYLINALAWVRFRGPERPPTIWTMGDDVIMKWDQTWDVEAFERALATTGIMVKQSSTTREFAGFEIDSGCVTPLYGEKHHFALFHASPVLKRELATAYCMLYAMAKPGFRDVVKQYLEPHSALLWRHCRLWARGVAVHEFGTLALPVTI